MFYTSFIIFIIYSFFGWLMEVTLTFIKEKKFVNRGFLIGPCCPIYGCGCLLLISLLGKFKDNIIILLILTILICSILEYFTSWILEKIFKLRWWDYSNQKFNINGRICLETMTPFTIIGVVVVKYVNPKLLFLIKKMPNNIIIILAIILFTLFILDLIISCNIINNVKFIAENTKKDSTEDIKKAVFKFIHNNLYAYKRIFKAFPDITKIIKEKTMQTREFISKHTKRKSK